MLSTAPHRRRGTLPPPDPGREWDEEDLPAVDRTIVPKRRWARSDKIAAVGLLLTVAMGVALFVPQILTTKENNAIAQNSAAQAAEANRIATFALCQDDSVKDKPYCAALLATGPGTPPTGGISAQTLEYPRDLPAFAHFDETLTPLLETRMQLSQTLATFMAATDPPPSQDAFRAIAQDMLDAERRIASVLSLRVAPPSAQPAQEAAPSEPARPVQEHTPSEPAQPEPSSKNEDIDWMSWVIFWVLFAVVGLLITFLTWMLNCDGSCGDFLGHIGFVAAAFAGFMLLMSGLLALLAWITVSLKSLISGK